MVAPVAICVQQLTCKISKSESVAKYSRTYSMNLLQYQVPYITPSPLLCSSLFQALNPEALRLTNTVPSGSEHDYSRIYPQDPGQINYEAPYANPQTLTENPSRIQNPLP